MPSLIDLTVNALALMPTPIMRHFSKKYIAGETIEQALDCLASFNAAGHPGIMDILGEDAEGEAGAREALAQYQSCSTKLAATKHQAYISAKPTHFGLRTSEELCFELYSTLASHCANHDQFLRVEMEDHTTTDATLRVFKRLLQAHANVGLVLQSRLFRNEADIQDLLATLPDGRTLNIRLVKGIYLEPAEIAHTDYAPIADAYVEQARILFAGGATVSLATHDEAMAESLFAVMRELGVGTDRYEMQVLMGVQKTLWEKWMASGHPVRVYVPFGPEWKAYSLRRLKKNPRLLRQVFLGVFRG
jgi:proline dehydrogenase